MTGIFSNLGVDIANLIDQNLSQSLLNATLIVVTSGARSSSLIDGTNPIEQSIQGKGFIDDYDDGDIDNSLIRVGDRKILLIGNSFPNKPVPKPQDKITIENFTYSIISVKRDPAAATYLCQVRG